MATNTGSLCVHILGTGELMGSAEQTVTAVIVYTYIYILQVNFTADQSEERKRIRPSMLCVSGVCVYISAN